MVISKCEEAINFSGLNKFIVSNGCTSPSVISLYMVAMPACLPTCPADVMEDAQQQGLGDAAGPPHRVIQLGQSPVKLLGLLGPDRNAALVLFLCGHGIATHTWHHIGSDTTAEDKRKQQKEVTEDAKARLQSFRKLEEGKMEEEQRAV